MTKKQTRGGAGRGQGRKPAPVGTIIMDYMPAMADVISGAMPRPVDIAPGADPSKWMRRTPAWARVVKQVRASRVKILARRGETPIEYADQVAAMRAILETPPADGVVILLGSTVYVAFNIDGTRAAMSDNPLQSR